MIKRGKAPAVVVAPVFVNGVCIVQELARKGAYVVAVDTKATAVGFRSRYVKERVIVASPEEEPGAFTRWLLSRKDLCGAVVVPTDDFFLKEVAENYEALSGRFKLAVSPGETTLVALDKSRSYEIAEKAGLAMPRTRALFAGDGVAEAAEYVGFPSILRPEFSIAFAKQFGQKMFCLASVEELERQLKRAREAGHKMLLQEVIPGEDRNVAVCKMYVSDAGEIMSLMVGLKTAIYPPRFGVSQMQVVRPLPEVEEASRRIVQAMGLRGTLLGVEWKYDSRDGAWKFLEVNARSMLAISVMKFVGADAIDRLWRDKLGLPQPGERRVKHGRKWAYVKNGLLLYRKHPEERKSIFEYMKLYRPPISLGLWDARDPRPFLYDLAPLLTRRLTKPSGE